jgi:phenylalanine-4-hydroxylase
LVGSEILALDPVHVPDRKQVSDKLFRMTKWTLSNVGSRSVSMEDWFIAMRNRVFPVTSFIRPPEHFDFTAHPDMFHEYQGHLPFLTDKKFSDMAQLFGIMCENATLRQLTAIARIWSHAVEFGLIKERGKIKILGAGLLSSYSECVHALDLIKKGRTVPFDLKTVITTAGRTFEFHKKYFVLESIEQIGIALYDYGAQQHLI